MLQKQVKDGETGIMGKYSLVTIVLLYILSNMFMFLNNGWYWDDWCLSSYEGMKSINTQLGVPIMVPINAWLFNMANHQAQFFHIVTGIVEIFGIVIFYKCLSLLEIRGNNRSLFTLLFAMVPYNSAKITIACFGYSIGFLFFLSAILLFIVITRKNNLLIRLLSLILFFCSYFLLPSTLVLALAFFLFLAWFYQKRYPEFTISYFKVTLARLLSWVDFIILPFIYWIFKSIFIKPIGNYAADGYREFSASSVLLTPIKLILAFIQNFIGLGTVTNSLNLSNVYAILFLALLLLLFFLFYRYKIEQLNDGRWILYIGLYFFFAGSFAYTMVGLPPLFDGYNSRHQILMKLGSAIILFYLVSLIKIDTARKLIFLAIISLFIVATISRQLQYQKSWFKQLALEKAFVKEKLLIEGTNFVITDNTIDYNEYDINYAFYCYTGILRKSFGTQTRFAIDSKALIEFPKNNPQGFIDHAFYHMKDCRNITTFAYNVTINPGNVLLSNPQSIKMLYHYYFDKSSFDKSLSEILSLSVKPYEAEN